MDVLALTDPLLARLPTIDRWRIGHFRRWLPAGYLESLLTNSNEIEDPAVRRLFEDLRLATRAPLASSKRWRAILRLNLTGPPAESLASYRIEHPTPSIPVYREPLRPAVEPPRHRVRSPRVEIARRAQAPPWSIR